MSSELAVLADDARLGRRVAERLGQRSSRAHVRVALRVGDAVGMTRHDGDPSAAWLLTGCLTKLLTAALVTEAHAAGELGLDERLAEVRERDSKGGALERVTIRHLLEHTHGLDGSMLDEAPVCRDGYLDAGRLCVAAESAPRLSPAGRIYSYGDLGAMLAAAALERRAGKRYAALLEERLFDPMGIEARRAPERNVASLPRRLCPATGGPLAVPLARMLAVLTRIALERDSTRFEDAVNGNARITCAPGWSLLERGVFLGWKHYGEGWFGHHSTWPGAEALVRVHVARRIALVVASSAPPAVVAAAKLFGASLPELGRFRIPQPLTGDALGRFDPDRFVGTYRTAAETITIAESPSGLKLHGQLKGRGATTRTVTARLRPARDGLLLTAPTVPDLAFVQRLEAENGARYLWNGRRVWRAA